MKYEEGRSALAAAGESKLDVPREPPLLPVLFLALGAAPSTGDGGRSVPRRLSELMNED